MYVVNSREVLGVPRTLVTMYLENQLFKTQYMTNLTIVCPVKFQHFWPKNDGEKWSRKNIFEIPPYAHHVIFITEFVLLTKTPPFYEVNSFNRKW